jgi:hypothetical protein
LEFDETDPSHAYNNLFEDIQKNRYLDLEYSNDHN